MKCKRLASSGAGCALRPCASRLSLAAGKALPWEPVPVPFAAVDVTALQAGAMRRNFSHIANKSRSHGL